VDGTSLLAAAVADEATAFDRLELEPHLCSSPASARLEPLDRSYAIPLPNAKPLDTLELGQGSLRLLVVANSKLPEGLPSPISRPGITGRTKKKSLTATEQAEPRIQELRRRFIELAKSLDPRRLVFIDEAGSNIAMTRDYARAPRGERVHGAVPRNRGEVTTMLGALGVDGVRAMMTVEGATDGEVFETFLERVLLRKLKTGDIVVLDNVGAHRTADVRRLIEAAGARVLYLPPYSPDLNPIELCWAKLKALLKEFGARTREALDDAIRRAMDLIDGSDALAWFGHCGYAGHLK
jgi:transposase